MSTYISPLQDDIDAATVKVNTTSGRAQQIARRELIRILTVALVLRDGTRCAYCRVETHTGGGHKRYQRTFDHIEPQSQGGKDTLTNGVISCQACNSCKKDRPVTSFAPRFWHGRNV